MMKRLAAPFWNSEERRLRSAWRVGLLLLLWYNVERVLPLIPIRIQFYVVVISITILLAAFALIVDRRSLRDYGLRLDRHTLPDLFFGLLWGGILVSLIVTVETLFGWLSFVSGTWTRFPDGDILQAVILMVLFFIGTSLNEEAIYRGYLLPNLAEGFGFLKRQSLKVGGAVLLSGILFGIIHFDNPDATVLSGINLVLYGFLLTVPFLYTGSLAITLGLHFTWNLFIGVVYGLPVSGYPPLVAFARPIQSGPELWTGGRFGPEGGLLVTLVLLVELGGFLLWIRSTRGKIALSEGFGTYAPVRVFSITPHEIREERTKLRNDEGTAED